MNRSKSVDLKAVYKAVAPRKSVLPIIQDLAVVDGKAMTTDLDVYAIVPTELPDGMYRVVGKDLEAYPEGAGKILDNFPVMPPMEGAVSVEIAFLRDALSSALNFTVEDPRKPLCGAVCLKAVDHRMEILAVNEPAMYRRVVEGVHLPDGEYIIPAKAVRVILLDKSAETLRVSATDKHIALETSNFRVITRKETGKYYHVETVIPKHLDCVFMFDVKEFQEAIKTLEPYTDKDNYKHVEIGVADGANDTQDRAPMESVTFTFSAKNASKHLEKTVSLRAIKGYGGPLATGNFMLVQPLKPPGCSASCTNLKQVATSATKTYLYMGFQDYPGDGRPITFSGDVLTGGDTK